MAAHRAWTVFQPDLMGRRLNFLGQGYARRGHMLQHGRFFRHPQVLAPIFWGATSRHLVPYYCGAVRLSRTLMRR